jgi:hypothetical protein
VTGDSRIHGELCYCDASFDLLSWGLQYVHRRDDIVRRFSPQSCYQLLTVFKLQIMGSLTCLFCH